MLAGNRSFLASGEGGRPKRRSVALIQLNDLLYNQDVYITLQNVSKCIIA